MVRALTLSLLVSVKQALDSVDSEIDDRKWGCYDLIRFYLERKAV